MQGYARGLEPFQVLTGLFAEASPERAAPTAAAALLALLCGWHEGSAGPAARQVPEPPGDAGLLRPLRAWMADCLMSVHPEARAPLLQVQTYRVMGCITKTCFARPIQSRELLQVVKHLWPCFPLHFPRMFASCMHFGCEAW